MISFFILTTLTLLFAVSIAAHEPLEESSCAAFSVRFDCSFPDNAAIKCSDADMDLINTVVHSIVELDVIFGQIDHGAPEFDLAYEAYGDNVTIDSTGTLLTPPDAETIANHITPEDLVEQMYYENYEEDGESAAEQQTTTVEDDEETRRRLDEELEWYEDEYDNEESGPVSDWHPIAGGLSGMGPNSEQDRHLGRVDCPPWGRCKASWCCWACGRSCRRRRRRTTEVMSLRAPVDPDEEVYNQLYLRRVKAMEGRVSKQLRRKLRYLALSEAIPCLGNFWDLKVYFKTNLANIAV